MRREVCGLIILARIFPPVLTLSFVTPQPAPDAKRRDAPSHEHVGILIGAVSKYAELVVMLQSRLHFEPRYVGRAESIDRGWIEDVQRFRARHLARCAFDVISPGVLY